LRNKEPAER